MSLMLPKPHRVDLPEYRRWIRNQKCVVEKCWKQAEASHVIFDGQGKWGSKVQDTQCVPQCRSHHQQMQDLGRETFERKHGLNLYQIIIDLLTEYMLEEP